MNYLGHAVLSSGDAAILTGNMIGDHVKGKLALAHFPPRIRKGLELHRKIDEFSDQHPATMRAKIWFREAYHLYAGAVMDILYDHFLANDAKMFPSEQALLKFSEETYIKLEQHSAYFPEKFAQYFPHMRQYNWLYGYRTMLGIQRSLQGLARRASEHFPPPDIAYQLFLEHYYQLAQCYYELIDDITEFVKIELSTQ